MGYFSKKQIAIVPDTAKTADMIRRNLTALDHLSVSPPLILQKGNGSVTLAMDEGVKPFWALISGSGNPYSWAEAKPNPDGSWTACCRSGNANAYEVNHVTGLDQTHQYLIPDEVGGYRFMDIRKGPSSCLTLISIAFLDLAGNQHGFPCGGVGAIYWTITGTTTGNKSISLSGNEDDPSTNNNSLELQYDQGSLPEGNYTLHVFSVSTACHQALGPDGRFDCSYGFSVKCPKTTVSGTCQATYDLVGIASDFYLAGCGYYWFATGEPTYSVTAEPSDGLTLCYSDTRQIAPNLNQVYKITSYEPFSITYTASGDEVITSTETRNYTSCGSFTNDWLNGQRPYVYASQLPISSYSYCGSLPYSYFGPAIDGATVSVSGQITASGTTQNILLRPAGQYSEVYGWASTTITNYIYPKVGVDPGTLNYSWTISYPEYFQDVTYNLADWNTAQMSRSYYGGVVCPLSGITGMPIDSKACCGCSLPVNKTLHASALGQEFTITYNSVQGVWGGFFSAPMNCLTCPPPPGVPKPTFGDVECYLYFQRVGYEANELRPYLLLNYVYSGAGPTLCNQPLQPTDTAYAGWGIFGNLFGPYGAPIFVAKCPPTFYCREQFYGQYGVNREDGSGIIDYYNIDVDIQIME